MADSVTHDGFPARITAGDSVTLRLVTLSRTYAPGVWGVGGVVRPVNGQPLTLSFTDSGGVHQAVLTLASNVAAGAAQISLRATETATGRAVTVLRGVMVIEADLASADGRSHAERTLAAIEAVIENRATKDQQAYEIAGRSLTRMPIADLMMFRDRYRTEVARERAVANGHSGRQVRLARFNSVGGQA